MVCTKDRPLLPACRLVSGCAQPQLADTAGLEILALHGGIVNASRCCHCIPSSVGHGTDWPGLESLCFPCFDRLHGLGRSQGDLFALVLFQFSHSSAGPQKEPKQAHWLGVSAEARLLPVSALADLDGWDISASPLCRQNRLTLGETMAVG